MRVEEAEKGYRQEQVANAANDVPEVFENQATKTAYGSTERLVDKFYPKTHAGCGATPISPLRARLQADIDQLGPLMDRTLRARQILRQHPEFEEVLELLELLGVFVPGLEIARG